MVEQTFKLSEKGKSGDEIIEIFKNTTRTKNSKGGRAGFMDGGASIINPESSINNSSGLNYLLGEDDNNRVDFKNGFGDLINKLQNTSSEKREEIEKDIALAFENNANLAMVDSEKGITNLHVPSDVIIDASMPAMILSLIHI